jgi:hypothetical protein
MYCDGLSPQGYPGHNAHPSHASPYMRRVEFKEALRNPPRCAVHDRSYLTVGGYRLSKIVRRLRETGELTAMCDVRYGFEQTAWCPPHGYTGNASDVDSDNRCPHWRLAEWLIRRHNAASR